MKTGSISALKYRIIIVAYECITKLAKSESDDSTAAGSTRFKMASEPASDPADWQD